MAKQYSVKSAKKNHKQSFVPEKYHDILYCTALLVLVFIFFRVVIFGGGIFAASDNVASGSFVPYLNAAKKAGEFPLWIPHIFTGLPGYAALMVTGDRWWDFIMVVYYTITNGVGGIFNSDAARVSTYYILYGIGMYLLMRVKQHERFVSFLSAFGAVFSTFVIVWVMIGHNTKPMALMTFPYIYLCLDKLREKFSLLFTALLIVAVHILVESTHVQMVFYGICGFGLYFIVEFITTFREKGSYWQIARPVIVIILAGGLSFTMAADRYLSVMEYTPYSTRGTAPIQQQADSQANQQGDYEYATNWSFSPEEMITFIIPNFYGFGKLEYKGALTGNSPTRLPTYWGQMPFTDAANYMGIGILLLAVFGAAMNIRNGFVQFLCVLGGFSLLLSFGKNFPLLYNVFYSLVPSFNKFRAPSIALALLQFATPILAGYGLTALVKAREQAPERLKKILLYGVVGAVVLFFTGILYGIMGEQSYVEKAASTSHASVFGENKETAQQIYTFVFQEMKNDWYTISIIAFVIMLSLWLYARSVLSKSILFGIIGIAVWIDLWRVDVRPMEVTKDKLTETIFRKTDVVDFLRTDSTHFRIIDLTSEANVPAYFQLYHAHGYHSAKLRAYQDILDVAGKGGGSVIFNPFLWNLLNVKYIITERPLMETMQPVFRSQESQKLVYENPSVLPRAFFVDQVEIASPMSILEHLRDGNFAALETVYLEQKPSTPIDTIPGDVMEHINNVQIQRYENHYIKIEATAKGNNLLFLSEAYYPAGWKAYIDGKETAILKANYAFRALIVPSGKHTVEMRFTSDLFQTGKALSLAGNIITLGLLIAGVWQWYNSKNAKLSEGSGE